MSTRVIAPTLLTQRLCLRPHALTDYEACLAMWSDPAVTRFIGGRPRTSEEVWAAVLRCVGHWAMLGYGAWVVEALDDGSFVGEVGFADFRRQLEPSLAGIPELGWALAPWAHRRGYATEAVLAALSWGDATFDDERVVCIIHPENHASIRVAEKAGFVQVATTHYKGEPTLLYERTRRQT